jgi:hypothetical protein
MEDVNTRDGVFSNAGFGGGLFNLNTAFGSAEEPKAMPVGRRKHFQDVSNLNAPYGNTAVQGLGRYRRGAGALGYYGPDHPWLTVSEPTKVLQTELNTRLSASGYQLLAVDGKMGPKTCGAAKFFGYTFTGSDPCAGQAVTPPSKPVQQQVVIGPATIESMSPATASLGGGSKLPWILGAVVGVGVVGYMIYVNDRKTTKLTWW